MGFGFLVCRCKVCGCEFLHDQDEPRESAQCPECPAPEPSAQEDEA